MKTSMDSLEQGNLLESMPKRKENGKKNKVYQKKSQKILSRFNIQIINASEIKS